MYVLVETDADGLIKSLTYRPERRADHLTLSVFVNGFISGHEFFVSCDEKPIAKFVMQGCLEIESSHSPTPDEPPPCFKEHKSLAELYDLFDKSLGKYRDKWDK